MGEGARRKNKVRHRVKVMTRGEKGPNKDDIAKNGRVCDEYYGEPG